MRDVIKFPVLTGKEILEQRDCCEPIASFLDFYGLHALSCCNKYLYKLILGWPVVAKKNLSNYLKKKGITKSSFTLIDIYKCDEYCLMQKIFANTCLMRTISSIEQFFIGAFCGETMKLIEYDGQYIERYEIGNLEKVLFHFVHIKEVSESVFDIQFIDVDDISPKNGYTLSSVVDFEVTFNEAFLFDLYRDGINSDHFVICGDSVISCLINEITFDIKTNVDFYCIGLNVLLFRFHIRGFLAYLLHRNFEYRCFQTTCWGVVNVILTSLRYNGLNIPIKIKLRFILIKNYATKEDILERVDISSIQCLYIFQSDYFFRSLKYGSKKHMILRRGLKSDAISVPQSVFYDHFGPSSDSASDASLEELTIKIPISSRVRKIMLHNKSYETGKIFITKHCKHFIATGYATSSERFCSGATQRISTYVRRNIGFWRMLKDNDIENINKGFNARNNADTSDNTVYVDLEPLSMWNINDAMKDYFFAHQDNSVFVSI